MSEDRNQKQENEYENLNAEDMSFVDTVLKDLAIIELRRDASEEEVEALEVMLEEHLNESGKEALDRVDSTKSDNTTSADAKFYRIAIAMKTAEDERYLAIKAQLERELREKIKE